ncbi:MAG TPA: beta-ketoacyl-[acyl-carrier-protein] synthase family protein [Steroidobacteraceae bacterium]|nr:beta-ketoacyl-[acyl-carrier-protein] synthase family protein [Steroidobacteraceae bacterium]
MTRPEPLGISAWTTTSALGRGRTALAEALMAERTGLRHRRFETCTIDCWIGEVDGLDECLPAGLAAWDCRNNRLAWLALQQDGFGAAVADARSRYGPRRLGIFMGTSTAGILEAELAYRARDRERNILPAGFDHARTSCTYSIGGFARAALGLEGVSAVISTACSSSAKVFASARRAIAAGFCDAAVVGGVDSLCLTTLHGFNSLQLVSRDACRPADAGRNGISIGEAAGFALLEPRATDLALMGTGESSDAYHMSTPEPDGRGAAAAMSAALGRAGLEPKDIDYVNLHGTATPANDAAEDRAVCATLGTQVPVSSTKGWTGHVLGAAGMLEAAIALTCITRGFIPRSLNTRNVDPALRANVVMESRAARVDRVMSNSFGFGGSNCTLILGRS